MCTLGWPRCRRWSLLMTQPQMTLDPIPSTAASTLDGLFRCRVLSTPDAVAYHQYDRDAKAWCTLTWADMSERVRHWQAALEATGLVRGDRVAVALPNGVDWISFEQAALGLGLVVVPLYVDDRPANSAHILADSGSRLLVLPDLPAWQSLANALSDFDDLVWVVLLQTPERPVTDPRVHSVEHWLPAEPRATLAASAAKTDALATLVYTSGTTGRPKGVMLSHANILSNVYGVLDLVDVYQEDLLLSFLPMAHMLERTGDYYLTMAAGAQLAFVRTVQMLAKDMEEVRPTALISVPRVYETVYQRVHRQLSESAVRRALFSLAVSVGWRRHQRSQGKARWRPSELLWPILERLVADKILAAMGGRLRLVVSGGAALESHVARTFVGLGLPVLQGYGLTETSPVIAVNRLESNDIQGVGTVLPGTEVRLGDKDEILVKGPGVMLGYWHQPDETAAAFSDDGWLRTGDQGRLEGSQLYITGRIKELIVLSNGENVPPEEVEMALRLDPLVEQAMVVGNGRPVLGALLVLDKEVWTETAGDLGLNPEAPESLHSPVFKRHLLGCLTARLEEFPRFAKVQRVHCTLSPWSIDSGLMTPTLKLKRKRLHERFAKEIDAMYNGSSRSS